MTIFLDLALNAVATGLMLGSIYALLSLGLAITFGVLHIPNVAHPALVVAAAFILSVANSHGADPILTSLLGAGIFYVAGRLFYEFYLRLFESRGRGNTMQSLTLFFGVALVIEVCLLLGFGADLRGVDVPYVGSSLTIGLVVLPYRLLVPAMLAPVTIGALWLYLKHTHRGRAIRAVAFDETALKIVGIDPVGIKRHAFGIAMATAAIAGAALIITAPLDPFAGRMQIGRVFAIVVLAGMGAIPGTLAAAILIGVAESLVATFFNPAWAPGVAFAILLGTLALKPEGLFGSPVR